MAIDVGVHWTQQLPVSPLPVLGSTIHLDTVITALAAMLLLLGIAALMTQNLQIKPSKLQTFGEAVYDFCRSITMATAGPRGDQFLFYIGSLFLFILTANLLGQVPWRLLELPHGELAAPTNDLNTTAALAFLTLVMYFAIGIRKKGLKYFKHYIEPNVFFLPINLIEDIARPGSLMIRLFFNILVGEILSAIALSVMPYVLPAGVILLELFVAVVQAYIFAILSSVYISLLSAEHH